MNSESLSREEVQALLQALGESNELDENDPLCRSFSEDIALLRNAVQFESALTDEMVAELDRNAELLWQERYGEKRAKQQMPRQRPVVANSHWLALAAVIAVLAIAAKILLPTADPTRPTIAWTNAADVEQKYDVWILPDNNIHKEDAEVLFVATNVRSPVRFDQLTAKVAGRDRLEKDKPHRLLVCLASAGRFAGEAVKFMPQAEITSPTPTAPDMLKKLLDDKRIREARQLLAALPESVREDPAVLELAKQVPP